MPHVTGFDFGFGFDKIGVVTVGIERGVIVPAENRSEFLGVGPRRDFYDGSGRTARTGFDTDESVSDNFAFHVLTSC